MSKKGEIIKVPGNVGIKMGSSQGECGGGFSYSIATHDDDGWVNLCLDIDTDEHKLSKEEAMKVFKTIIEDFKSKYLRLYSFSYIKQQPHERKRKDNDNDLP